MPWGLKRFHASGQPHFVTFSCYHRRPSLTTPIPRQVFEAAIERVRLSFELCLYGYVIMPEHVHLLLSELRLDRTALKGHGLQRLRNNVGIGDWSLEGARLSWLRKNSLVFYAR
jgi:REP element-mobilizing transposase RayT